MAQITFGDGISIAMLIFYSFCLPVAVFVSLHHGIAKKSGWIFLAVFSVIRIVGCSSDMVTITEPSNVTAATIAGVTTALGLSPLLLASLGLTSRLYRSILKSPWNTVFSTFIIKSIQVPCMIALVLCIVGATNASDPGTIYQQGTLRAGVIVFVGVLAVLSLLTAGAIIGYARTGRGERPLLLALSCSLLLLIPRMIYSLIDCFGSHRPGSVLGSATQAEFLYLFLAVIEEITVTMIYLHAGLILRSTPVEIGQEQEVRSSQARLAHQSHRGGFGGRRLGKLSTVAAVIGEVVHATKKGREGDQTTGARSAQELGLLSR